MRTTIIESGLQQQKYEYVALVISKSIKAHIDDIGGYASFDFSYWKGFCNAVESINSFNENILWNEVRIKAIKYCDKVNSKTTVI